MLLEMMELPKIAEDEDIVGWFDAMAEANGWDSYSFKSTFFPESPVTRKNVRYYVRAYTHFYKRCKGLGFPAPEEALMKHTAIPVSGLFSPPHYTGMMADMILNGTNTEPFSNMRVYGPFMYCPECAKEDIARQGRAVVHVPHQVRGVAACYRHGVLLSGKKDERPVKAEDRDIRTARMIHSLYKAGAVGSIRDLEGPLKERMEERGIGQFNVSNISIFNTRVMAMAAELFTDTELMNIYKKEDALWIAEGAAAIKNFSRDTKYMSREFPFLKYTCGRCGTKITAFNITALAGGICPECASRTQWQARYARMAKYCMDPAFRIVRFRGEKHADIRHVECGRVIENRALGRILRVRSMDCPFCRKDSREAHLGEKRRMNCGIMATVTAISSYANVTIRFENGSERTGVQYRNFLLGNVVPEGFYRDSHIGETKMMDCGLEAEIIRYESQYDMDVRFSDGSERYHVTYAMFRTGKLQPEGFRMKKAAEEVIGKWRMMNCGLRARITARRSSLDCDVEFEDGSVRRHVRQDHFMRGELSPEGFYFPKVGKERVMRNGLRAKIIAMRSARDIDIQFENGEIRTGIQYTAFRDGYVKSLLLKKERRDSHIGEVYRQNCGLDAKVISYKSAYCCTARFSNGEVRENVIYRKLKEGGVLPPSMQRRSRVGDRYPQSGGETATIIADRGSNDMDVQYDNGIIREHVALSDLKKGRVPSLNRTERFRREHLGEERVMKCGLRARVAAIRSATDIDILFETGELKEHVTYGNFKNGAVSPGRK